jgi:hypothetical protein
MNQTIFYNTQTIFTMKQKISIFMKQIFEQPINHIIIFYNGGG